MQTRRRVKKREAKIRDVGRLLENHAELDWVEEFWS
jgi:hypothetical protein